MAIERSHQWTSHPGDASRHQRRREPVSPAGQPSWTATR